MTVTPLPRDPEKEQEPRRSPPPAPGRAPSLLESFNYAVEGVIHVLRTQRNLRIHFLAAVLVFAGAIAVGVSRLQLIALVLAIAFVLVAEMLNTAIEGVIDVSTTSFDPNAKLAKDIAAGAVLIASVTAVAVGFLVFQSAVGERATNGLDRVRDAPADITLVALFVVVLLVIATKAWTGRGTPLRGGL
ncbi:MAG TPA: diacylglycerol kinase family protein, partial [Gaiellaceae bacterium]|nr:diacylglycerol kinase family protein [Gaiellaceae bacterium]